MSKIKNLIMRLSFALFAIATDTGCNNKVQVSDVPTDSDLFQQSTPPPDLDLVQKSCAEAAGHNNQSTAFLFPKPSYTCEWNQSGNLGKRDLFFQARIEQERALSLPAGAIICDIKLEFKEQAFLFDDHFLMTFNGAVIASSYDFQTRLSREYGLLRYDWSKLVGMEWDKSREGVYCAAGGNCSWPKTDTRGTIIMSFPTILFQRLMAEDIKRNDHALKFISIGDNDSGDCEHSNVEYTLHVDYVMPQ